MNFHEKIALMIIAVSLVMIAMVGVFAGDLAFSEQTEPGESDQTVSVGADESIPQISEYADLTAEDSQLLEVPPFANAADDEEVEDFLPARPGFLKPAFESDPEVAAPSEAEDADPIPDVSEPPATEVTTEATTEITTEATTVTTAETTTAAETTTKTTPAVTTQPVPETTKKPETQKPAPETTQPVTTQPQPEVTPTPSETDLRAAIVAMAKSQIGVTEKPYNNVKYNTWYYGHEVSESRKGATKYAWCVVFLSWCADQSGVPKSVFPKIGAVSSLKSFFVDQGRYYKRSQYTPVPGDIAFFNSSHAGLVVSVDDGKVMVIEGNSSDKVSLNTYNIGSSKLTGYGSPKY